MITLECLEGCCQGRIFEFPDDSIVFGRNPDCDVWIDDATCSREHARIEEADGAYFLVDLDSTNGAFVNGAKVQRRALSYGDRILLGKNLFLFLSAESTETTGLGEIIDNTLTLSAAESRLLEAQQESSKRGTVSRQELESLRKSNIQLQAVYSLSRALSGTLEIREVYQLITFNIFRYFREAERVCIFIADGQNGKFRRAMSNSRTDTADLPVSRDVLERVRRDRVGILASDVERDLRFAESETLVDCQVRSLMCVPLCGRERLLGAVYVESNATANCFEESDLELLTVFGNQMASGIENASLYQELENSFYEAVRSLSKALEAKDKYTRGHSGRVALYAAGVGRCLGLSSERLNNLKIAAELHDIGKIAIPEEIINSKGKLTAEEFEIIKRHPDLGVEILRPIGFLKPILPIVRHHHERYNGEGYPEGFAGEEIPLEARILNLADAFDAMTTKRPYNEPLLFPEALARCQSEAGISFDANCVDSLCEYIEDRFGVRISRESAADTEPLETDELSQTPTFDEEEILKEIETRTGMARARDEQKVGDSTKTELELSQ